MFSSKVLQGGYFLKPSPKNGLLSNLFAHQDTIKDFPLKFDMIKMFISCVCCLLLFLEFYIMLGMNRGAMGGCGAIVG